MAKITIEIKDTILNDLYRAAADAGFTADEAGLIVYLVQSLNNLYVNQRMKVASQQAGDTALQLIKNPLPDGLAKG